MISSHTTDVAERAKAIYSRQLQTELEAGHPDRYVAIEPESGEHFSPIRSQPADASQNFDHYLYGHPKK